MAKGYFFNGVVNDGIRTDFGVYTDEMGVTEPEDITLLVKDDKAFQVEVVEKNEGIDINLVSRSREINVYLGEMIEKSYTSGQTFLHSGKDPVMPGEYDNPHNAISMYAEYAINHGDFEGLEMDFEWENILDKENRGL